MGCVLHLDRFLFQPIWNQMYNCQFVWPFCLEYQNITCMDRSLSRCLSWARVIGIVWFSQTSKTLWNIRESLNEAKPCNKLQAFKPTDKISESFLLTKVCYWQRQRQGQRQKQWQIMLKISCHRPAWLTWPACMLKRPHLYWLSSIEWFPLELHSLYWCWEHLKNFIT